MAVPTGEACHTQVGPERWMSVGPGANSLDSNPGLDPGVASGKSLGFSGPPFPHL